MKKNNLFLALIVVITSSCASLQHNKLVPMDALVAKNNQQTTTILTKDSVIIPNVYITKLKNDTVYYKKVDPQSYAKRMKFTSDSLYSIYAGETLAGLNYNHKKRRPKAMAFTGLPPSPQLRVLPIRPLTMLRLMTRLPPRRRRHRKRFPSSTM